MAAQTITTTVNFDSPSTLGLLNGEAITVNGGALTSDSDVRWNQNAAVFGSITVSATLGGSVLFEGRNVWELPYTAASGNVPVQAALGSNGVTGGTSGATGELLRVWASGSLTPATAGGAMPASGWVKLRSKAGAFQAGEAVTLPGGATIIISNAGKRSWLHLVGAESGAITIPRLGDVKWRGEWYELGTTNGTDDQTFQYPVADACPAIWIEKYAGAYAALGDAGLEPWLNAGPRWGTASPFVMQDARGKYFGQNVSTGVITIAQRANNACGLKPATGLRVFVPNLIFSNSNSTNWDANTLSATFATRYEIGVLQSGVFDAQGVAFNWYLSMSGARSCQMRRVSTLDGMALSAYGSRLQLSDFALGIGPGTTIVNNALSIQSMPYGVEMTRCRFTRYAQSSTYGTFSDLPGSLWENVEFDLLSGSAVFNLSGLDNLTSDTMRLCGVSMSFARTNDSYFSGTEYANLSTGTTTNADGRVAIAFGAGSNRNVVDGFANYGGIENVHPYAAIFSSANSSANELRNVGTRGAPYPCGTGWVMGSGVQSVASVGDVVRNVHLAGNRLVPVSTNVTASGLQMINTSATGVAQTRPANDMALRGSRLTASEVAQNGVYGTHFGDVFTSNTAGAILLACNEPSVASAGQVVEAFAAGSGWTGAGSLSMATMGDSITWTMDYFALGHTALASSAPTITGTNVANHSLDFQADTGSGWSAWAALTGANLAAVGAINPATGVKLKVRATVTTASASNLLTNIRIDTVTDATSQQMQYPLPGVLTTLVAQVPLTGAEVRVYDLDNLPAGSLGTELAGTESAGSSFAFDAQPGNSVWLQVMAPGFVEYGQQFTVPAANTTLSLILTPELNT